MTVEVNVQRANGLLPARSIEIGLSGTQRPTPGPPAAPAAAVMPIRFDPKFARVVAGILHSGRPAEEKI